MIKWIVNAIAPLIFHFLDRWIKQQEHKKEMVESYYNFLDMVDKSGQVKVANHLSGKAALKTKQEQLLKELEDEKNN
jgi:hypothetical protein